MSEENKQDSSNEIKIEVISKGPLFVYGDLSIKDVDGNIISKSKRTSFCRCGASQNKPFCDGAHKSCGFTD